MLRGKKLAVFIDVDNTEMDFESYQNAMAQVEAMGEIVCATVYGASERKQKGVIDDAKQKGYNIQLPARSRKRIRKVFDDRIWVDVTDLVAHNANIDTVAIIAIPTDMVYLFSYLRRLGLQCVGCEGLDEASAALVADTVKIAAALPKTTKHHEAAKADTAKPVTEKTESLLREIDKLREDIVSAPAATEAAKPLETAASNSANDDGDPSELIGKIEEMYKNDGSEGDDKLVAEIQKLLSGLD